MDTSHFRKSDNVEDMRPPTRNGARELIEWMSGGPKRKGDRLWPPWAPEDPTPLVLKEEGDATKTGK